MPTNKELVKLAQAEQTEEIAKLRVGLLNALDELESIGGKDDYRKSLQAILAAYPDGIRLSKVQSVMGDTKTLTDARKKMEPEIEQIGEKNALLKPKPTVASKPAAHPEAVTSAVAKKKGADAPTGASDA